MLRFEQMTREEIREAVLFHGTSEKIEGQLKGGAYDHVLWTAEDPTIAQNYIPISGITLYIGSPHEYELDEAIYPDDFWYELANKLGYYAEVEKDSYGQIVTWNWKEKGSPTYRMLVKYLENELGYDKKSNHYALNARYVNGERVIFPKDYKFVGQLYFIIGKEKLNIFDYASDRDADLSEPDYNKHNLFKKLQELGYDGIKIHDWAQSKNYGNVNHTSIGLFQNALSKIKTFSIPATNFDWENLEDFKLLETPDFIEWHKEIVMKTLKDNVEIPKKVLNLYPKILLHT